MANAGYRMRSSVKRIILLVLPVIFLFLIGAERGGWSEPTSLGDQKRMLLRRIEALKREQNYLLFQQAMYSSDSKYLIINTKSKTGYLKYKNRLLKNFQFKASKSFPGRELHPETVVLTEKVEGKNGRSALVFGKSFVVKWKLSEVPRQEANLPSITVTRKELLSIFYAVETGSMAYIEP